MEPREKPKDPSDPREYEAIPRGGWKLAAGLSIALLALIPLFATLTILLGWLPASLADLPTRIVLGLGAFEGLAIAWFTFFAPADLFPKPWLKEYWRRNVRGYVVAHYTEGGRARCSDPFPRGHERLDVFLNAYPFVVLWPLGGWFSRPRAYWRARQSWWSVARDTRFPGTPVKVTDKNGSSLQFATIGDAMSFIAQRLERTATEPFWHDSSDMPFSWLRVLEDLSKERDDARRDREELDRRMNVLFDALREAAGNPEMLIREWEEKVLRRTGNPEFDGWIHDWMVEQVRRLVSERDAARGEVDRYTDGFLPAAVKDRDAARQEREEAAAFIVELDRRFEESSRLHDKLQALRIHERIRERLYFHRFPTAWETSVANAHQQHDADAVALAEVRVRIKEHERRDRIRHKKGATAAT